MKLNYLKYLLSALLPFVLCCSAWCQKENADTIIAHTKSASVKSNEVFFDAVKAKLHNDDKQAIELFEQFVALDPQRHAGYYELSKLYESNKRNDKAEENIKKALAIDKNNKWYKDEYASILAKEGHYFEAGKIIEEIAEKDVADVTYLLIAEDYFERAQKYDEALACINKAITRGGSEEEIQLKKAQLYLQMNRVEDAASVVRELIKQDPKNGKYYKLLGEIYDNNKMADKAFVIYQDAEKIVPGDPTIEMGLAEHYLKQHDTANYRIYTKKAIVNRKLELDNQLELFYSYIQNMPDSTANAEGMPLIMELVVQHPNDAQLLATYAEFLEVDNKKEKAIVEYKKSLAIKSSDFNVWERLLGALTDKNDADSLIKYSEKVIRLFPNQSSAHYYNGIGHFNKKEYSLSVKALNRAADMAPESNPRVLSLIYTMLADVYNITRQFDLSDKSFDKALQYQPNDATILNNYSYYLSERGQRLNDAEIMSQKSLEIRPNEVTFLDTYGWILYKKGMFVKAKEIIEKAVSIGGAKIDGTIYDHLGDIYYKLSDKTKAIQYWKLAKEKGDESPLLEKKISEEKLYE